MNARTVLVATVAVAMGLLVFLGNGKERINATTDSKELTLDLRSDKAVYFLGQPVDLTFKLTNLSEKSILLKQRPDVWTGYLSVWIKDGNSTKYKLYRNTTWGLREGGGISIQVGEAFESTARVLRNVKPDVARLSPGIEDKRIITDFAFSTAGEYSLKLKRY